MRFLRLARKPTTPRPEAKSGSAPGKGVAVPTKSTDNVPCTPAEVGEIGQGYGSAVGRKRPFGYIEQLQCAADEQALVVRSALNRADDVQHIGC